jgi:hypothetical protein
MSYLGPGKPIDVLRSTGTGASTKIAWANSGYIDFVTDCGADPTGVASSVVALNAAFALISASPAETLVLFIPPGTYKIDAQPTTWDMSGVGTSVKVKGAGDASVFSCSVGMANVMWHFHNVQGELAFEDFAVEGTTGLASQDASYGILVDGLQNGFVTATRLHFDFFCPNNSCIAVGAGLGGLRVQQCWFTATSSSNGAIWSQAAASLEVIDCVFLNGGNLNGTVRVPAFVADNTAIFDFDAVPIGSDLQTRNVLVSNCLFDSLFAFCVAIEGSGANIERCRIEGCLHNPSTAANPNAAAYSFTLTNLVEIDGVINSGASLASTAKFIDLTTVAKCHIRGAIGNPAAASNVVTANATTGTVRVRDSTGVNWSQINEPTVLDIDDPRSSSATLTATQIVVVDGSQIVVGSTAAGGAPVTVDTFIKVPNAHGAKIDIVWSTFDAAANVTTGGNGVGNARAAGGVLTVAGQFFSGVHGDGALAGSTLVLAVSAGNTLTVTFTPPMAYANALAWTASVVTTESPAFT